jgi:hypothetical protein
MKRWISRLGKAASRSRAVRKPWRLALEQLEDRCLLTGNFLQINLVSDIPGMAALTPPMAISFW